MNSFFNFKIIIIHLIPDRCPKNLIILIIFIETIRFFIRPLTLRIRLISNITAGHLLLFLLRKVFFLSFFIIILELIVSLIQGLVFRILLTLYYNERR
ncbi:MAG: F0F1 ATP synthase subunit A [Cyanophyceae cyanobacterium]